jgi:3-hydroxybutyryl-CoA dehydrogenase
MQKDVIGIVGLGLLGRGIASCFLAHGYQVFVHTQGGDAAYAAARRHIAAGVEDFATNAAPDSMPGAEWEQRYIETRSLKDFAECTFVVESVPEDIGSKQAVFAELETVIPPDAPIATNTSALPVTTLQRTLQYPERLLGMHWAEPAYATRFLELIRGEMTSDAAMDHAAELGRRLGKDPCFVQKDIPGFIVNRLGYAMYREAIHLLESGIADVDTIDRSFRNACGLWASFCGPFRWIDITGGPALYAKAMEGVLPTLDADPQVPKTLAELAANNQLFYAYSPGDLERWQELLHAQAWAIRALQQNIDRERCELLQG